MQRNRLGLRAFACGILAALALGLASLGTASATVIGCTGGSVVGCIQLTLTVTETVTQRITEVQVNDVEGVTGGYNAPDPFAAPLLTNPGAAQAAAFADLGVPGGAAGLMTMFDDIADFTMSEDSADFNISQNPNTIFIADDLEAMLPSIFAAAADHLVPNVPTLFPGDYFGDASNQQNLTGLVVVIGQLNFELFREVTTVDAYRMTISQKDAPPTASLPEPGTLLLFGVGLAGFAGIRRQRSCAGRRISDA